ncbi:hypothetical protein M0804_008913 [Polistes exclamans]|nr:hypothetical protein M0804_008913 [Polistes exclamans]
MVRESRKKRGGMGWLHEPFSKSHVGEKLLCWKRRATQHSTAQQSTPAVLLRAVASARWPITPSTVRWFLRLNGQLVPT